MLAARKLGLGGVRGGISFLFPRHFFLVSPAFRLRFQRAPTTEQFVPSLAGRGNAGKMPKQTEGNIKTAAEQTRLPPVPLGGRHHAC